MIEEKVKEMVYEAVNNASKMKNKIAKTHISLKKMRQDTMNVIQAIQKTNQKKLEILDDIKMMLIPTDEMVEKIKTVQKLLEKTQNYMNQIVKNMDDIDNEIVNIDFEMINAIKYSDIIAGQEKSAKEIISKLTEQLKKVNIHMNVVEKLLDSINKKLKELEELENETTGQIVELKEVVYKKIDKKITNLTENSKTENKRDINAKTIGCDKMARIEKIMKLYDS